MQVIDKRTLPTVRLHDQVLAHILEGSRYPGVTVSAFIVDAPPGTGPKRHLHPYEEVFVIIEGTVRLEAGDETLDAGPDDICVVPAGVPHSFVNVGPQHARMVNIHAAAHVVTEFVEAELPESGYRYNQPAEAAPATPGR